MGFVPAAHPLADDGGEPVRARVVAVDDSTLTFTGLIEYGTQNLEVELLGGPAAGGAGRPRNGLRAWRGGDPATARERYFISKSASTMLSPSFLPLGASSCGGGGGGAPAPPGAAPPAWP